MKRFYKMIKEVNVNKALELGFKLNENDKSNTLYEKFIDDDLISIDYSTNIIVYDTICEEKRKIEFLDKYIEEM